MHKDVKTVSVASLGNKDIKIKALTLGAVFDIVADYKSAFKDKTATNAELAKFISYNFVKLLPQVTDMTMSDIKKLTGSDVERLFEEFKEINSFFLKIPVMLGLGKPATQIREMFLNLFIATCAKQFQNFTEMDTSKD